MKFKILLLTTFVAMNTFAQRTLPNPIILVHGWTGSNTKTWAEFTNYLEGQALLSIEKNPLNYELNCDNNKSSSYLYNDVCDFNYGSIGNKDVYVVNFDNGNLSNQSAAVKQGYALKFAIAKVLNATGADKVILLGHSMGGLAAREYLQTPSNWLSDGQHHVAKIATIGTPHRGSDVSGNGLLSFFGKDENSEAVRDLRDTYIYSNCTQGGKSIKCPGVYLWGGQESKAWMISHILGTSNFYNLDVNCNGYIGDNIIGLNQKSPPVDVDFSCVIGGPDFNDGAVSVYSQNLNNVNSNFGAELFYFSCSQEVPFMCHSSEPKKAFVQMIQALDEPKKYPTQVKFNNSYKGFFSTQESGRNIDTDTYKFRVPQRGVLTISVNNYVESNGKVMIKDPSGNIIFNELISNGITKNMQLSSYGDYSILFEGNSLGAWATYNFSINFCALASLPTIVTSNSTSFCEGQSVNISTANDYDSYKWYKDGVSFATGNQITVNQTGVFTVQALKCGVISNSANSVSIIVKPNPPKPIINKDEQPSQFVLTSNSTQNNQWFLNGNLIEGAINQAFIPQELGIYTVKVTKEGCSTISDNTNVKMEKPLLTLVGLNPFCEGDSSIITTSNGFSNYIFSDGVKEIAKEKNEFFVKISGKFSVITKRGKFTSPVSDQLQMTMNLNPTKPIITIENIGLKSSSTKNNQWFLNGSMIKDSTGQFIRSVGSGIYTVKVTENGCVSESNSFLITATEPSENDFVVKLYPNPNEGTFWIELPDTHKNWEIEIYDILGKQIMKKHHQYKDSLSNKEEIRIVANSGIYILQVLTNDSSKQIKFVIK
jgi:Secretion system C-terminal sorting domain/PGAP1-like protein